MRGRPRRERAGEAGTIDRENGSAGAEAGVPARANRTADLHAAVEAYRNDPNLADLRWEAAILRAMTERMLTAWAEADGIDPNRVKELGAHLERIARTVERHEKIRHQRQNVVTQQKMMVWIAQVVDIVQTGIRLYVSDEGERDRLRTHVREGVAKLGVPDVSG